MRKIVFLIGSVDNSHTKNRIEAFVREGFDIDVYGFSRKNHKNPDLPYKVEVLGEVEDQNYQSRLSLYFKSIKAIKKRYEKSDIVVYVIGMHLASFVRLLWRNVDYIYEEADLVHTYFSNKLVRDAFEIMDKNVAKHAKLAVYTSEGFVQFHYGEKVPQNVIVIANKLNQAVLKCPSIKKSPFDKNKIKIGFVGWPRFDSILSFVDIFCSKYPSNEMHIYGAPISEEFEELNKYPNYYLHGRFKNPDDLPTIYENIDLVLSAYDTKFENVRYAEPNKIYEAIYFETPIIVSKGTFLGDKVTSLGIGYVVDAMDKDDIQRLVDGLTIENFQSKIDNIRLIPKSEAVDNVNYFITRVKEIL